MYYTGCISLYIDYSARFKLKNGEKQQSVLITAQTNPTSLITAQ